MIKFSSFLYLLLFTLLVFSCSSNQTQSKQKSNLTFATIKKHIIKNKTSQAEVIELLGSPNITSKTKNGREVWTYSRQSTDSKAGGSGWTAIFAGSSQAYNTSSSSTFDLIIKFNKKDIVVDYSIVSSQF